MKKENAYKFGSLPVLNIQDGKGKQFQLAQTQAILRYIAQIGTGKNGEQLYPGNDNPALSYEIDTLIEDGENFFKIAYEFATLGTEDPENKFDSFVEVHWPQFLTKLEKRIRANSPYSLHHLVGKSLTIADISIGAHILKLVYNRKVGGAYELKEILEQNFPKTW